MKKILMTAVLAFSASAFADTATPTTPPAVTTPTPMIYCDYNATPQEDSIFMDLYMTLDPATNTYQNLEVGFLNVDNTGYPDYLYTVTATATPGATETPVVAAKDADTLSFALPSTTVTVNNVAVPAYNIGLTDNKVNSFDLVANGTFNGKTLTNITFTCYDPSLVNTGSKLQQR